MKPSVFVIAAENAASRFFCKKIKSIDPSMEVSPDFNEGIGRLKILGLKGNFPSVVIIEDSYLDDLGYLMAKQLRLKKLWNLNPRAGVVSDQYGRGFNLQDNSLYEAIMDEC